MKTIIKKPLNNYLLFYDENCPFCIWYSKLFISTGLIDASVRVPFYKLKQHIDQIDEVTAKNKIPLLNLKTGTVSYGIDALIEIFSGKIPILKYVLRFKPIYVFLNILYALISFNRKVIFPYHICSSASKDYCQPTFNRTYRWLFIILTIPIISTIVQSYSQNLHDLINPISFWQDALLTVSMFPFQAIFLYLLKQDRKLEYLGNLAVISITGAILLIPMLLVQSIVQMNVWIHFIYFLLVHFFMIGFHYHRSKVLFFDKRLTATLVLFRILLLIVVLTLFV